MKKLILIISIILSVSLLFSCGDDDEIPEEDGLEQDGGNVTPEEFSSVPFVGDNGNWFIGDIDTGVSAVGKNGLDGKDGVNGTNGSDGKNGADGITPHIGENGNWFIGDIDTGILAEGKNGADGKDGIDGSDGKDGIDGADGKDGIDGKDGEDGVDGVDGTTPHIGENGNWFIGDIDTGILAEGKNGSDGTDGTNGTNGKDGVDGKDGKNGIDGLTPYIGANGNWFIGTQDTGVRAEGKNGTNGKDGANGTNGKDGTNGKNGADGITPHIGENGNWFIGDTDTGVKAGGKDGSNGQNGTNGVSILRVEICDGILFVTYSDNPTKPIEIGSLKSESAPAPVLDYYRLPDGTLGVKAGQALYSEEIIIPESYGGLTITEILPGAFKGAKYLKNVTIPGTVTKISTEAFSDCPSIISVFVPKTVKYIEENAFDLLNTSIVCVQEKANLLGYDKQCFGGQTRVIYDCATDVQYQDGIGFLIHSNGEATIVGYKGDSYKITIPEQIAGNKVTLIGDYAFKNNKRLISVTIPTTVEDIGIEAFNSKRLKEIYDLSEEDLSEKIQDVSCDVYNSIDAESKLVDTEDGFVFYGNELVDYYGESEAVVLPANLNKNSYAIGAYAFSGSAARIVTFNSGTLCTEIYSYAFTDSEIASFNVPSSVTIIHGNAFFECAELVSVEFDAGSVWSVDNDNMFTPSDGESNLSEILLNVEKIFKRIVV